MRWERWLKLEASVLGSSLGFAVGYVTDRQVSLAYLVPVLWYYRLVATGRLTTVGPKVPGTVLSSR
jgi:hypothetical protein